MARLHRCFMAWPFFLLMPMPGATVPARGAAVPAANLLTIRLERKRGDKIEPVRPEHVFDTGDIVRFRVTGGQDGYLYVLDHGSSGTYSALFPAPGGAGENQIQKGSDYLVPAIGDGWFEIEAPSGFDVVYFLLSPTPLHIAAEDGAAPAQVEPPTSLKPRCNDAIFQARGECIDSSAGPAPLARDAPLPPQITRAAPQASRDILFTAGDDGNSVKASAPTDKPVVYTFRLAHR